MMARIRVGDDSALASVYDQYSPMVHGIAQGVVGADADEICQDVFMDIWLRPDRFDPERGSLRTFVAVMTRRRCIDHLRSIGRRRERERRAGALTMTTPPNVDEAALAVVTAARVRQALTGLPLPQRTALELAYLRGLTFAEVAVVTGAAEGTAKSASASRSLATGQRARYREQRHGDGDVSTNGFDDEMIATTLAGHGETATAGGEVADVGRLRDELHATVAALDLLHESAPPPELRVRLLAAAAEQRPEPAASPTSELFRHQVQALAVLLDELGDVDWSRPVEHYDWTVHGLVAHLLVIENYTAGRLGLAPDDSSDEHHLTIGAERIAGELEVDPARTAVAWLERARATAAALHDAPAGLPTDITLHGWPFSLDGAVIAEPSRSGRTPTTSAARRGGRSGHRVPRTCGRCHGSR